jgi:hypothetical protein
MANVVVENPVLNSRAEALRRHLVFDEDGMVALPEHHEGEQRDGRRR